MSPQARCWSGFVPFTNPAHFTVSHFRQYCKNTTRCKIWTKIKVIFSIEKNKLHFLWEISVQPPLYVCLRIQDFGERPWRKFWTNTLVLFFFCQNIDVVMIRDQTALKKCKIGIGRLFSAIKVQSLEFAKTFPFRKLFVYKMLNLENKWMVLILHFWKVHFCRI